MACGTKNGSVLPVKTDLSSGLHLDPRGGQGRRGWQEGGSQGGNPTQVFGATQLPTHSAPSWVSQEFRALLILQQHLQVLGSYPRGPGGCPPSCAAQVPCQAAPVQLEGFGGAVAPESLRQRVPWPLRPPLLLHTRLTLRRAACLSVTTRGKQRPKRRSTSATMR